MVKIIAFFAGILKLRYDALPNSMPVYKSNDKTISIDTIINKKKDSIIVEQKNRILILKDRLRKITQVNNSK